MPENQSCKATFSGGDLTVNELITDDKDVVSYLSIGLLKNSQIRQIMA
jgi:hypothetical protein